jgi:hypothetical protein
MKARKDLFLLIVSKRDPDPGACLRRVLSEHSFAAYGILKVVEQDDPAVPIRMRDASKRPMVLSEFSGRAPEERVFEDTLGVLHWLQDQGYDEVVRFRPDGLPLETGLLPRFVKQYRESGLAYGSLSSWNAFLYGLLLDAWALAPLREALRKGEVRIYPDGRLHLPYPAFEYDMDLGERAYYYGDLYDSLFSVPHTLQVELSAACNSRCPKCLFHGPNTTLYRPRTESPPFMERELFQRIIDEFSQFKTRTGLAVALNYRGECQLHPDFYDFVAYARERGVRAVFNTNAKLLTPEAIRRLLDLDLSAVSFSVDSLMPGLYDRLQGGKIRKVLSNIDFMVSERARQGRRNPVLSTIHVVTSETVPELPGLVEHFLQRTELVSFFHYQDIRKRTISSPYTFFDVSERYPCGHLWEVMTILSSGKVIRCGYDFNHEDVLGDLQAQSILEVWNGERMTSYRRKMCEGRFGEVLLCSECPRWKAVYKKMDLLDGLLVTTQWEGRTLQKMKDTYSRDLLPNLFSDLPRSVPLL